MLSRQRWHSGLELFWALVVSNWRVCASRTPLPANLAYFNRASRGLERSGDSIVRLPNVWIGADWPMAVSAYQQTQDVIYILNCRFVALFSYDGSSNPTIDHSDFIQTAGRSRRVEKG